MVLPAASVTGHAPLDFEPWSATFINSCTRGAALSFAQKCTSKHNSHKRTRPSHRRTHGSHKRTCFLRNVFTNCRISVLRTLPAEAACRMMDYLISGLLAFAGSEDQFCR